MKINSAAAFQLGIQAVMFLNNHQTRSSTPKLNPTLGNLGKQNPRNRAVMLLSPRASSVLVLYSVYSLARNFLQVQGALLTRTGLLRWESYELYHSLDQPY